MLLRLFRKKTERPTILFLHIPKAAGTTLTNALLPNFSASSVLQFPGGRPLDELSAKERARLQLVYGHFEYGVHELLSQPSEYVTLLREPVDRVISLYCFIRREPRHRLHASLKAEDVSLEEFLDQQLTREIDNHQTRLLSGARLPFGELTRTHLERAKRNLARCAVVGVQHRFEEFFASVQQRYALRIRPVRNELVAPQRIGVDDLDRTVYEKIAALNQFDAELFDFADSLKQAAA